MVIAVTMPISEFNLKDERDKIQKPAINTIEVTKSAVPTVENAYLTASSELRFNSLRALRYLLKKCTVSSTTIPSVMPTTTESARPISPEIMPHKPNAMPAGTRFGIMLISPIFTERKANIKMNEMQKSAMVVALNMLLMLRMPMLANIMVVPVPCAFNEGVF